MFFFKYCSSRELLSANEAPHGKFRCCPSRMGTALPSRPRQTRLLVLAVSLVKNLLLFFFFFLPGEQTSAWWLFCARRLGRGLSGLRFWFVPQHLTPTLQSVSPLQASVGSRGAAGGCAVWGLSSHIPLWTLRP